MNSSNVSEHLDARIFIGKPSFFLRTLKTAITTTTTTVSPANTMAKTANFTNTTASILDPKVIRPEPGGHKPGEGEEVVCAPFSSCNPIGCEDPTIAPIDCSNCNKLATEGVIFGMLLLSLFIILANLLVIRVILRTPSLRRRHGYIKLSLATSDILVGLFVIPSGIAGLVTTLYYPFQTKDDVDKYGEIAFEGKKDRLLQTNSATSVVFGTIAVISVTSSLYNLLLLSADRFLAIARPFKHRAGRFSSKKSLWFSIAAVWIFGISLSVVPGFFGDYFSYQMDLTTFFFVQNVAKNEAGLEVPNTFSSYYISIIVGGPYFATVILNVLTAVYTWRSIKVRKRLSSRGTMSKSVTERKCERNRRMKMLQEAYPEVTDEEATSTSTFKGIFKGTPRNDSGKKNRRRYGSDDAIEEKEKQTWLSWWRGDDSIGKFNCSNSNNHTTDSDGSQQASQSPRFQRTRDQIQIVRDILNPTNARNKAKKLRANYRTHIRVFKMLIAMIVAYSICLLPYVIVALKISDRSLTCDNLGRPFTFAMYMLFLNSGMNFIIYNLWHPEFRQNVVKTFRKDFSKTSGFRRAASGFFTSSHKGTESSLTYASRVASTDSNHNVA